MAQTREGAEKIAAKKAGLTVEEYRNLRQSGLKRCTVCKFWHKKNRFGIDKSRCDGLSTKCCQCIMSKCKSGPGKAERKRMKAAGYAWCKGCKQWLRDCNVSLGKCRLHHREYERTRYNNDPDYRSERIQHSISRKRGVDPVPLEGMQRLLEHFRGRCAYCNNKAESWDHMDPVSLGGMTIPGNIVPCCISCNSSKNNTPLEEWLDRVGISDDLDKILLLREI